MPLHPDNKLTPRHEEIVALLHRGYRNKEMAKALGISEETVKRHLSTIFDKVGCGTRLELVQMTVSTEMERLQAENDEIPQLRETIMQQQRTIEDLRDQVRMLQHENKVLTNLVKKRLAA